MSAQESSKVLVITCPDTVGIVHAVSGFVASIGANITRSDQYSEVETQRFFMRCEFHGGNTALPHIDELADAFRPVGNRFAMEWRLFDSAVKSRVLIAVSKFGHCLNDLLFRWSNGDLPIDIVGVVSNHLDLRSKVEWYGLPYHHLPITRETKPEQERALLKLVTDHNVDLLILARYMQILSGKLCEELEGRAINIHHSFLPSFKGARPYHQAHERGVKLIGATAHYVTTDLDEGPIIEQDVQRVMHAQGSDEIVRVGRDVESRVLARAVRWHCERRVLLSDHKTIVFS